MATSSRPTMRPNRRHIALAVALIGLLCTACHQERPYPATAYYVEPGGHDVATVIGSGGYRLFKEREEAYVYAVDGHPVRDPRDNLDEALALSPGTHHLILAYRCSKCRGYADVALVAELGKRYDVHFKSHLVARGEDFVDLWVEEQGATAPVTAAVRANVTTTITLAEDLLLDLMRQALISALPP